jgi:hypothetical protein
LKYKRLDHTSDSLKPVYSYQAFGLIIESTVACPELLPQEGAPDVTIHYGDVPESLDDGADKNAWYQQNSEAVLLKIDSIAKYLILRGEKIIIERASGSHNDEVRLYLFGSAFGALLHQRGMLPLHGSAIEVHGSAVVFVGPSGCGKSTLAGAFHQRGYRLVADDICVLSTSTGELPMVFPGFPRLKLWSDALKKLGKNSDELLRIIAKLDKFHLSLREEFCHYPRPLNRIYELAPADTQEIAITRLQGMEKLTTLIDHTYRLEFLTGPQRKQWHFKQCAMAARHAAVSRVTRPSGAFLLDDLADLVEQDWA